MEGRLGSRVLYNQIGGLPCKTITCEFPSICKSFLNLLNNAYFGHSSLLKLLKLLSSWNFFFFNINSLEIRDIKLIILNLLETA